MILCELVTYDAAANLVRGIGDRAVRGAPFSLIVRDTLGIVLGWVILSPVILSLIH